MKLFRAEKIREIDAYTIQHEPVTSINLMERAALACFQHLKEKLKKTDCVAVFCGMGNNGGDGLALTRLLNQNGYQAFAYIIKHTEKASHDNHINHQRLKNSFPKNHQVIADSSGLINFSMNGKPNRRAWIKEISYNHAVGTARVKLITDKTTQNAS